MLAPKATAGVNDHVAFAPIFFPLSVRGGRGKAGGGELPDDTGQLRLSASIGVILLGTKCHSLIRAPSLATKPAPLDRVVPVFTYYRSNAWLNTDGFTR